ATEIESAAGGAIFFLSDTDLGGADLYTVPLTPPAANPVVSARVMDRVFGFKIRDETTPARLLVARADGNLYYAALAGGGVDPAGQLFTFTPSLDGSEGIVNYASVANAFGKDGKFLPLTGGFETLSQVRTNSPFGGPYRPEYSQIDGNVFSGASSSLFKVW